MTLVNVSLTPNRALIAADSLNYHNGRPCRGAGGVVLEDTKIIPMLHAHCVLSMLGSLALRHRVQSQSFLLPDVHAAISRLPKMLRHASGELRLAELDRGENLGDTAVLVGWSRLLGRLIFASFKSENDFEPSEVTGIEDPQFACLYWRSPGFPLEAGEYPNDVPAMLAFARRQVAHFRREQGPSVALGGRLMVAEITEASITLCTAGNLGLPAID